MDKYRHSGGAPLAAILKGLAGGLAAGLVGGFIYAYAIYWIPIIYLNFLATLAFGAVVGWSVGSLARSGNLRNTPVVAGLAGLSMLFGLWVYWGASLWLLDGDGDLGIYCWSPRILVMFVQELFANNQMHIGSIGPIRGWFLVALWALEAGTLFYTCHNSAVSPISQPFCERCQQWTVTEPAVARFDANGHESVWQRVITDDFPALGDIPLLQEDKARYVQLDFAKCPQCVESNFLTINALEITTDSKGNTKTKKRPLIRHGILTTGQAEIIRHLALMAVEAARDGENQFAELEAEAAADEANPGEQA